ncbi:MAG: sigma-70 family RNA polymerase sigma factor [Candidatus Omnitrophota bacterium]|jgi:RNA polymerase sigma-70 factor (ECF subfamily)
MIQDPDAGLIAKAKRGDKAEFGKLVTRHYDMVYAIAYGVLNHRESALDVAQEVFVKVYKLIATFEGKSKFKTWLHRIAVNAAIDQARKKRPMESLDLDEEDAEESGRPPLVVADSGPGPRERFEQSEMRELIDKAMRQLSADHKAVLVLREWQGLSYEEIAETLGVEVGTVMSRLFYARKKLADALGPKVQKEVL